MRSPASSATLTYQTLIGARSPVDTAMIAVMARSRSGLPGAFLAWDSVSPRARNSAVAHSV